MSINLIIDSREDQLIQTLQSPTLHKECGHIIFEIESLPVGDILFKQDDQMVCLIERKTFKDYAASIYDKRSKNQSIRISQLKKDHPDMLIIYLIEGQHPHKDHVFPGKITRDAVYSSIIHRVVRDHFTIYHTHDICDTALIIAKLYDKLPEFWSPMSYHEEGPQESTQLDYLKTIKLSKKDNLTPFNCYLLQLAQIPGLSIDTANLIAQHYPTLKDLVLSLSQNPDQTIANLSQIQLSTDQDKSRRLGPVLSNRIHQYLCAEAAPKLLANVKLKLKSELIQLIN